MIRLTICLQLKLRKVSTYFSKFNDDDDIEIFFSDTSSTISNRDLEDLDNDLITDAVDTYNEIEI